MDEPVISTSLGQRSAAKLRAGAALAFEEEPDSRVKQRASFLIAGTAAVALLPLQRAGRFPPSFAP